MADKKAMEVTNEKLERIARLSAQRLPVLIGEMEEDILLAIRKKVEEAQALNKEKVSFSLTHTIKLDLGKDSQTDSLAVGIRVKNEISGELPDPDQTEMEFDEWLEAERERS